jgi:hypothetical protein
MNSEQVKLAAQEAASAASRGDKATTKQISDQVAGDSVVDRAKFAVAVLREDAEAVRSHGRFWP